MTEIDIISRGYFETSQTAHFISFEQPVTREEFIHYLAKKNLPVLPFVSFDLPFSVIEGNGKQWFYTYKA